MPIDENGNPIVEAPATGNMDSTGLGNSEVIADLFSDAVVDNTDTPSTIESDKPSDEVKPADVTPSGKEPVEPTKTEVVVPPTGEVVTPSVTPTEPVSEVETLKKQIETLTTLVDTLSGGTKSTTAVETPAVEPVKTPELEDLFKDMDFDAVMESKENFIKFFKDAMAVVKEQAKQETLVNLPNVVGDFVQRQTSIRDVATEFYTTYPELKKVKQYVAHVANTVSAEQPEWNISQVLIEAAKRTKETLNLQAVVEDVSIEKTDTTKHKPSLPGGTQSSKTPKAPSNGFQDEINDLITD